MAVHNYTLGTVNIIEQLFPAPGLADPGLKFVTYSDVISHYTASSLKADGIGDPNNNKVLVGTDSGEYKISIDCEASSETLAAFGERHAKIFNSDHATKAIRGMELLKEMKVWNPMKDYNVNGSPTDGTSKWSLYPPLGLNVIGQKGLLLMHYPPWACLYKATFDNAITMNRWTQLLTCSGVAAEDISRFKTIIDINPIAAPGSGESEYPNDYFPIMMASGFFDGAPDRDYIKSMLELYLSPPSLPKDNKYTLPLLICGSPLYDPQAPAWFRVAYTKLMPKDKHGIPQVNVLQTGTFRIRPDSEKETPYLIANHMIAAGVTWQCTDDASKIPNVLQYEAQDMVAATFLKLYSENPNITPEDAKAQACQRWYGDPNGKCAPYPEDENDRRTLCALAQMDQFFNPNPPSPVYSFAEAQQRCKDAIIPDNPCFGNIKPPTKQED